MNKASPTRPKAGPAIEKRSDNNKFNVIIKTRKKNNNPTNK
jgi:hypothetical protein